MLFWQSYTSLALTMALVVVAKVQSKPTSTTWRSEIYFGKFDYLPVSLSSSDNTGPIEDNIFNKTMLEFHRIPGSSTSGELDKVAMELMSMPYWGIRDKVELESHNRSKRYTLNGRHWRKKNLTYRIVNYPKGLTKVDVDIVIARAFDLWSEYTDLSFTPKKGDAVDITIKFVKGAHGDMYHFDGQGGTLAHVPFLSNEVHFDDAENWSIVSFKGINLLQIAAHEFGHILGLLHSNVTSAVMNHGYYGYISNFKLDPDDILGIQHLHGKKSPLSLCEDPKIDTIFKSADGITYVFKGNKYYKIFNSSVANGYPKLISEGWPGLPDDIDAAFTFYFGSTLFFKGTKYWHYNDRRMQPNFPRYISKDFIGIPDYLDTALAWDDIIYFFKGSQFWRYDPLKEQGIDAGYPKPISIWKGLPNNLDAAYRHSHGSIIFFKNYKHYRLNASTSSVDSAVTPYVCNLAYWFGCKNALCNYSNIPYFLGRVFKPFLLQL